VIRFRGLFSFLIHSSLGVPLARRRTATYSAWVPTVWKTSTGKRFHRSTECHQIKRVSQYVEITLDEIDGALPCRSCYHDAPISGSLHHYCVRCQSFTPCEHNGGIRVPLTRTRRTRSPYMDQGETYTRFQYVWPEHLPRHVS
jgi:hypothetical protein